MLETLQDIFPVQPAIYVVLQDHDQDEASHPSVANDDAFPDVVLRFAQAR